MRERVVAFGSVLLFACTSPRDSSRERTPSAASVTVAPAPTAAPNDAASFDDASVTSDVARIASADAAPTTRASNAKGMDAYVARLHAAGDAGRCDAEVSNVARDLAADKSLSTAELRAESKRRDTTNKGSMPYPSPGTSCAIFGIQTALKRAIDTRGP